MRKLKQKAVWIVALLMAFLFTGSVQAGWYSLHNQTELLLIIQEEVEVRGEIRLVNPKRLAPGELAREVQIRPTKKHLLIFDARQPGQLLGEENVTCPSGDNAFSIRATKAGLRIQRISQAEKPDR